MVFGAWQPLDRAGAVAPDAPGVLQLRGDDLVQLPRGKSAMIFYAASTDTQPLSALVASLGAPLARAAALGARRIRFAATTQPQAALARLLANFDERFGALPPGNRAPHDRSA